MLYSPQWMNRENAVCFGLWADWRGVTVRVFYRVFSVCLISDELFGQRQDKRRIRFCGLSFKLFAKRAVE